MMAASVMAARPVAVIGLMFVSLRFGPVIWRGLDSGIVAAAGVLSQRSLGLTRKLPSRGGGRRRASAELPAGAGPESPEAALTAPPGLNGDPVRAGCTEQILVVGVGDCGGECGMHGGS